MSEVEVKDVVEREEVSFTHYETKEVRTLKMPTKIQQFNAAFIGAFMTSEEHYQDLPWYREVREVELAKLRAAGDKGDGNLQIKAFPQIRIQFVKKYFPQFAPKEKTVKPPKPEKIDIWDI